MCLHLLNVYILNILDLRNLYGYLHFNLRLTMLVGMVGKMRRLTIRTTK